MFVSNNSYQKEHNCTDCKHKEICKYVNDMSAKRDEVKKIKGEPLSPVRITFSCKNYERVIEGYVPRG